MRRILVSVVGLLVGASAVLGYSRSDHGILNATSHAILLDVDSSLQHDSGVELAPGESFVFNGIFTHVRIHYPHRTVSLAGSQLRALHGGSPPTEGRWLVDEKGLRFVSVRDYMDAFKRMAP